MVTAVVLAVSLIFAGFSGAAQAAPGYKQANAGKGRVILVTINLQALFFVQMLDGAKKEAAKLGVPFTVVNANNDAAGENNAIEDYVHQKVSAIIVDAIDVNGIKPAIKKAHNAGIPVVSVDAVVKSKDVSTQVGVDNAAAGRQMGRFFNNWAVQRHLTAPKLGVVGALNSAIQIIRQDSFTRTVRAKGAKIVQVVDGQNVAETAQTAAQNLFTANPSMDAVYATGEPALIGSIAADGARAKKVPLFGWDLSKQAISAIDGGYLYGVVQQDPYTEGVRSVDVAVRLSKHQSAPKNILVPITVVTKANVNKYRKMFSK